jgi:phage terminase large subunit GpA-like protein
MTSERRDPENGRWEKVRANVRNEALDVAVYAWAIAHLTGSPRIAGARVIKLQALTAGFWTQLEEQMCPVQGDLFGVDAQRPAQDQDWKRYEVL